MPAATTVTAREALDAAEATLRRAGVETARADAEWLLAGVLGVGRAALGLALLTPLAAAAAARYEAALRRRAAREPLQQILGWEGFRGVRLRITGDTLVPRPETELLVEWALELLPPGARVVDVGTGSGCIACAIAVERPDARVVAIDVDPAAAALARDNARALGVERRVQVLVGDLLSPLGGVADVIVSNPPYGDAGLLAQLPPEVARHEPRAAVDGGADGLGVIRLLVAAAPRHLASRGALVLETAGGAQARQATALLSAAGFVDVTTRHDLAGVERFVAGRRG